MYKIIRPEKDATIYEYEPELNAGIDEVLELNTRSGREAGGFVDSGSPEPSRILMQFPEIDENFDSLAVESQNVFAFRGEPLADRQTAFQIGSTGPNVFVFRGEPLAPEREEPTPEESSSPTPSKTKAWLRMWFANGQGLPKKYTVEAYPVVGEWEEGRGRLEHVPATKQAVNWLERKDGVQWSTPGGEFDSSVRSFQTFEREDPDLILPLGQVLSSDPKEGILLKREKESFSRRTELKFFSLETRTIYVPHVLLGKDTYEFEPEGAPEAPTKNISAIVSNLQNEYRAGQSVRMEVKIRKKFEQREFLGIRPTDRSDSVPPEGHLPERSLTYEIRDARTGLKFMPFDRNYTAVSFDGQSHYFDLDLTGLFPERTYEIRFKFTKNGNEEIFENKQTFRINDG